MYKQLYIYVVSCSVFLASHLRPFYLQAICSMQNLLGLCYVLDDLLSTHTHIYNYIYIIIYMLRVYFLFTTYILPQHYLCLTCLSCTITVAIRHTCFYIVPCRTYILPICFLKTVFVFVLNTHYHLPY